MSDCAMCGNDLGGEPVVCRGCSARGERDLRDLPRLATVILGMAREPAANASEPISGSRERPLPLHTGRWSFVGLAPPGTVSQADPADAACQVGVTPLADSLHVEATAVALDLGVTTPRIRRNVDADVATGAFVRFLLVHHHQACRLGWAAIYLTQVHRLWSLARTYADDWPLIHKLPAPCPYCWTLTLRRDNGASFVYCDDRHGGCGRRWAEDDYRRLVLILVSEAKEHGWANQASAGYEPTATAG